VTGALIHNGWHWIDYWLWRLFRQANLATLEIFGVNLLFSFGLFSSMGSQIMTQRNRVLVLWLSYYVV
jgi:hypothetical protein